MHEALLTGAGGFVGRALARHLPGCRALSLGAGDWEARLAAAPLAGATVFHLAARVHDPRAADVDAFHRDNVEKTRRLGEAAARRGARRLVFVSSIKVHGEESGARAFRPADEPAPQDAYGRSKMEAERALAQLATEHGLAVVVVRPPLVLGPGARGNLESLMALADSPWPLPLAAIDNRRSFVHVDDLARLLLLCGSEEGAVGRTFIGAHAQSVSTPQLVGALRRALGRPERLFPLPPAILEATAALAGQGARARRLTRSLVGDPSEARERLGWSAGISIDGAAQEMARAWRRGWR
jgi:nucleoside-diphosphate-sugar epimerase